MNERLRSLILHQETLKTCVRCTGMIGPVVMGHAVLSPVVLIGQAPGAKEGQFGKPFAWTAGKTLFKWFAEIGIGEDDFRRNVYMAAVCRCFPGKNPKGGDRVPAPEEIAHCADWLNAELRLLRPKLIIPVGKLAIRQILVADRLDQVIGLRHELRREGLDADVIPLPHPSGASTWHRREPGKTLLYNALRLIHGHPAWGEVCRGSSDGFLT
ncbi:uracil-DNA glycosylase family protein [Methylocaldum sp.]|uniref:uracil-DNA glycosylase family protein n=1 Tax=Methylocaldum sp. TaxID=1969727 RepID=UPI002D2CC380|nr:uracil-DNA glycosylase family protein [Methylocaldum sp.]HYE35058.1 uracil-DNA glycosylase family protein [Methylocaldum sp.]